MSMDDGNPQLVADPLSFAWSYQLEALDMAIKGNTIVFLEPGTGKTLIAIMLLRSYSRLLRKPSPNIAVFLVPTVVLVDQQAGVVASNTDLKVGKYYGGMGLDFWDEATWKEELDKNEVLVMTPQILLDALRHAFIKLDQIKVLIFDECHNARGKSPYACIMTEFYHRALAKKCSQLPRIFGMTASPIKAKVPSSSAAYWEQISELENLMHSKVFTCESDSVLTPHVPFSIPKLKLYNENSTSFETLEDDLRRLAEKHISSLSNPSISSSVAKSTEGRLKEILSTLIFCLNELGIWLAVKAVEVYSRGNGAIFMWGEMDIRGERVVKAFIFDALKVLSARIRTDLRANMTVGFVTSKIICLFETLLEYREMKELRCIIFVERVVTAIVIRSLLNELFPELTGWKIKYTAGHSSKLRSQSRKVQNKIVDDFRNGKVNVIIATTMLEEGLDVQACNLVIRFDPCDTISSFIQSRGRARMPNSDFVLMVKSDDPSAIDCVGNYSASGSVMRLVCLSNADSPCEPLAKEMYGEPWYKVESTGALVTLNSSVALLHIYCSRLPSHRYPLCTVDEVQGSCTLELLHGCPIPTITISGHSQSLKRLACLEACKELHRVGALTDNLVPIRISGHSQSLAYLATCKKLHGVGALTDNLVPDIVEEEAEPREYGIFTKVRTMTRFCIRFFFQVFCFFVSLVCWVLLFCCLFGK